jgi:hypothetical protein
VIKLFFAKRIALERCLANAWVYYCDIWLRELVSLRERAF